MPDDLKDILYRYLLEHARGRANAIKFRELGEYISLEPISWRVIAAAIERLRLEGRPVCTSRQYPFGAYIPATLDEARESLRTGYAAAKHQFEALRALERALQGLFGEGVVKEVQMEFKELKVA